MKKYFKVFHSQHMNIKSNSEVFSTWNTQNNSLSRDLFNWIIKKNIIVKTSINGNHIRNNKLFKSSMELITREEYILLYTNEKYQVIIPSILEKDLSGFDKIKVEVITK